MVDVPPALVGPDSVVAIVVPVVGPVAVVAAVPAVVADVGCVGVAEFVEAAGGIKADSGDSLMSVRLTSNLSFPFFRVAVPLILNLPVKVSFSFAALAVRKHQRQPTNDRLYDIYNI